MKRTSLSSKTLLLGIILWGNSALALNISLDPDAIGPFGAGDTIEVDIVASDLGENEVITAFDTAVAYDDTLLTLDGIDYTTALGDPACELNDFNPPCDMANALFDGNNIEGAGFADPNLFSLLTELTDLLALQGAGWDGVLATLSFTANSAADGTSFALAWGGINDVKCNDARDPSDLDYVCYSGETPVSEPGTLLLLGLGIFGLAVARRGRRVSV